MLVNSFTYSEGRDEGCVLLAAPPSPYRATGLPDLVIRADVGGT